jgi:hypothetical protein
MKSLIFTILLLTSTSISFLAVAAAENSTEADAENQTDNEAATEDDNVDNEGEEESNTKQAVLIKRHIPNTEDKRSAALLHHMMLMKRADEVINLSNAQENFYGLYLPQASGQPQGAILILHDKQQHGHWPEVIGPLREYLPLFGWSTLTIELPDTLKRQRIARQDFSIAKDTKQNPSEEDISEATEQEGENIADTPETENQDPNDNDGPEEIEAEDLEGDNPEAEDNDNEPALPRLDKLPDLPITEIAAQPEREIIVDLIADYQSQNRERINTAIEYLNQQNQYNIVIIGFGQGASWAIDYAHRQLKQNAEIKGLTLITIDALPNPYDEGLINQQLAEIPLPFLDLLQNKKRIFDRSAKKRLAIMRRNNNAKYQQIVTQEINGYDELENPTNRRIRGWIKKNAGGTQIPVKEQP